MADDRRVFEKFAANIRERPATGGAIAVSLFATHYARVLRKVHCPKTHRQGEIRCRRNQFNEAEACVLQKLASRVPGEGVDEKIWGKYSEIAEGVLDSIRERHDGLDRCENYVKRDGALYIGRERWQNEGNYSCISIECIDIHSLTPEILSDDTYDHPFIGLFVGTPKKPAMEVKQVERILRAAEEILPRDKVPWDKQERPQITGTRFGTTSPKARSYSRCSLTGTAGDSWTASSGTLTFLRSSSPFWTKCSQSQRGDGWMAWQTA